MAIHTTLFSSHHSNVLIYTSFPPPPQTPQILPPMAPAPNHQRSLITTPHATHRQQRKCSYCTRNHIPYTSPTGYTASHYLAKTFTTPSPPPLTTHRPSWLHTTLQTPSPRMSLWLVISCAQARFSSDQNRSDASWPPDTSSRPSGDIERHEIAAGCASMLYVHWPI